MIGNMMSNMRKAFVLLANQISSIFRPVVRVVIFKDEDAWVAHGLEIDFSACGSTVDKAVNRFAVGLAHTLYDNIQTFGTVARVWRPAPEEIHALYSQGKLSLECTLECHKMFSRTLRRLAERKRVGSGAWAKAEKISIQCVPSLA